MDVNQLNHPVQIFLYHITYRERQYPDLPTTSFQHNALMNHLADERDFTSFYNHFNFCSCAHLYQRLVIVYNGIYTPYRIGAEGLNLSWFLHIFQTGIKRGVAHSEFKPDGGSQLEWSRRKNCLRTSCLGRMYSCTQKPATLGWIRREQSDSPSCLPEHSPLPIWSKYHQPLLNR